MSDSEKTKQLAELVEKIENAVEEAKAFAIENDLEFSLDFGYGMGGTFQKFDKRSADYYGIEEGEYDWFTSTMSCS